MATSPPESIMRTTCSAASELSDISIHLLGLCAFHAVGVFFYLGDVLCDLIAQGDLLSYHPDIPIDLGHGLIRPYTDTSPDIVGR